MNRVLFKSFQYKYRVMHPHYPYMFRCIDLAKKGNGYVAPNPLVGSILVCNDQIISEGYHQKYGLPHAEVNCINSVPAHLQSLIPLSRLYVNLEPCTHYGKTPPCVNLIIEHKIKEVIIGTKDPFALVAGKGIKILEDAGVKVTVGVLENECMLLNKRFFTFQQYKRPYIILKWAESQDNYIAPVNGKKHILSNIYAQLYVHKLRSTESGILIGYNTAIQDNPQLNNRYWGSNSPLRIVLDPELKLPAHLQLFSDNDPTLIINKVKNETLGNKKWIKCLGDVHNKETYWTEIMHILYQQGITSVIIEGGTKTLQPVINLGFWDEAIVFHTPHLLVEGIEAPVFNPPMQPMVKVLDNNYMKVYTNANHL